VRSRPRPGSRRRPGQTALRAHERHRIIGLTLRSRYTELTPRTHPLSRARFHHFWVPLRGMSDCFEMIFQERSPRLRRWLPSRPCTCRWFRRCRCRA
jgi:hypothetical protein